MVAAQIQTLNLHNYVFEASVAHYLPQKSIAPLGLDFYRR